MVFTDLGSFIRNISEESKSMNISQVNRGLIIEIAKTHNSETNEHEPLVLKSHMRKTIDFNTL